MSRLGLVFGSLSTQSVYQPAPTNNDEVEDDPTYTHKVVFLYPNSYTMSAAHELINFVKTRREQLELTQQELADRARVGLRFIR